MKLCSVISAISFIYFVQFIEIFVKKEDFQHSIVMYEDYYEKSNSVMSRKGEFETSIFLFYFDKMLFLK